ncbi:MAG: membrane protein insertase YidC [Armatimonadetes bacterium]|nr:membrane protein insertase YidC [Armatimonadota bacterium]
MDKRRLINILVIWLAWMVLFQLFFRPGPPQPRQPVSDIYAAAQKAETDTLNAPDNQVSLTERIKRYEKAIGQYRQVRQYDSKSDLGINAYVGELRVLDRMTALQPTNTGFFDRQEMLLKEMEQRFKGRSASITEQLNGESKPVPNVSQWAEARLNQVRSSRDSIFEKKWQYRVLAFLVNLTGRVPAFSYWFALLLLTLALKGLLWPLNKIQFQAMRDMQRIQPQIKELQEELKRKGRPQDEINRRMMEFYREQRVNPLGGCLPAILQMAVLIPVWYMIRQFEYQFTHGYFLWINPHLGERFWWIAKNLASFDVPIFLIYLASTVLYSLLQPKPADPEQARTTRMMAWMMPVVFGVMMWTGKWSSAFMLYWLFQNLFSMWQNWGLLRQPARAPAAAAPAAPEPLRPMQGQPGTNGRRDAMRSSRGRRGPRVPRR